MVVITCNTEIDQWISDLQSHTPPGYHFTGVPVHFCYWEPRRIRKYMLDKYTELHSDTNEHVCLHDMIVLVD